MKIHNMLFGQLPSGEDITIYTLDNTKMCVQILNYGGIIQSIKLNNKDGRVDDVVLGYDNLGNYLENPNYFGCIIGRHCNRIAKGRFTLNGVEYRLAANIGANHLHGGNEGFNKKVWNVTVIEKEEAIGLDLKYISEDGEEGYPGTLTTHARYLLTPQNELHVEFSAQTDKDTIVNLTQHTYFNLSGFLSETILDHELQIFADHYTPINEDLIPTGEIQYVKETPMDFRELKPIGKDIGANFSQLKYGNGYDHNWVLKHIDFHVRKAARVRDPISGRILEVFTTQPGIQLYTGNYLNGTIGKQSHSYKKHAGFALETQFFPDSPNQKEFPPSILKVGDTYMHKTIYRFTVE